MNDTTSISELINDDEELVQGIRQRNQHALERLYCRYQAMLRSIAMQVLHDDAEVNDVLQDVFLQVWDRVDSYSTGKGKLASWLCTLARRRAIDRLRQHSAYRRATDRYEISCELLTKETSESHAADREAHYEDLRELLEQQLKSLPTHQEQVVRMAFIENRSQREISALTQTPLGTVKTRIELGMRKLSGALQGLRSELAFSA